MIWKQVASDDFNRPDINPIPPPWILGLNGKGRIITNAIATVSGADDYATYDFTTNNHQKIKVTMLNNMAGGGIYDVIGLRVADPFNPAAYIHAVFSGGQIVFAKNGAMVGLPVAFNFVANDIIEAQIVGNDMSIYKNGVFVVTRSMGALPAFNKTYIGSNRPAGTRYMDDFTLYELDLGPYIGQWILRLTDNFNRANENTIAAPWVILLGPGPLQLNAQAVKGVVPGLYNISLLTHPSVGVDQRVDLHVLGTVGGFFGTVLRFNPGPNSGYLIVLDPQFTSWQINTYVGGAVSNLANGPILGGGVATNCILRTEIVENNISVYVDDVLQTTLLDFTFQNNAGTGIVTAGNLPSVDDYNIYSWEPGAARRNRRHRGGELWGIVPEVANYLG